MRHGALRGIVRSIIEGTTLAVAMLGAFLIRFDGVIPIERTQQLGWAIAVWVVATLVGLALAGINRHSWQYVTLRDMVDVTRVLVVVAVVLGLVRLVVGTGIAPPVLVALPYGVIAANLALSLVGLTGIRALRRVQSERRSGKAGTESRTPPQRAVLIGAGHAGMTMLRDLRHGSAGRLQPVAFVDDDPIKLGRRVAGLDVVGTIDDLVRVVAEHHIDTVIITIARARGSDIRRIVAACDAVGIVPKIVPTLDEIVHDEVRVSRVRDVAVEDLLGRDQVTLEQEEARALVSGHCVLVTGAGGSIGSELVRQSIANGAGTVLLVERSEPALWAVHREAQAASADVQVVALLADVTDRRRMEGVFDTFRPDVVLHAAAHKHVPMMEHNPGEAVKNNVGGTQVLVDLAADFGVDRFVLISTDKAVNPTSVMGATKRVAERYLQHVAAATGLHAVAVRFGNVLDSQGSVVPIFREQVRRGGPVTVTHPGVTRFFMTIPEASQLVLEAAAIGHPGEILVLDMGEPVRIVDLAESVIRLSGLEPGRDIPIEFTGLRAGEKLYEELLLSDEGATRTRHPKIWIGSTRDSTWDSATADIAMLLQASDHPDLAVVRMLVRSLVPEYAPQEVGTSPESTEAREPEPLAKVG